MSFFKFGQSESRIGLLMEIGSASVLTAFVRSDLSKNHPEIIWSKREYVPLKREYTCDDLNKSVLTALFNSLLNLDGEGRKALKEHTGAYTVDSIQVSYSAPFAHTITKTITYKKDTAFELSSDLISELLRQAEQEMNNEIKLKEANLHNQLHTVSRFVISTEGNGYVIKKPQNQMIQEIILREGSSVVNKKFVDSIADFRQKFQPKSRIQQYSFMTLFYLVIRELESRDTDYCLVNVTFEATELAIVRDGGLRYTTHVQCGLYTLARKFAEILNISSDEAYGYFAREDFREATTGYSEEKQTAIDQVILEYKEQLSALFAETGDSLTIPKRIYIHSNLYTENFINKMVAESASQRDQTKHAVYNVTTELLQKYYTEEEKEALGKGHNDTGLLISAQFFHNPTYQDQFEQL